MIVNLLKVRFILVILGFFIILGIIYLITTNNNSYSYINTVNLKDYDITVKSIIFNSNVLSVPLTTYCLIEKNLQYQNPTITIFNKKAKSTDIYEIKSLIPGARVALNGGINTDTQYVIRIEYENYTKICDGSHQLGLLSVYNNGEIKPVNLPANLQVDQLSLLKKNQNVNDNIDIYPSTLSFSDFNRDGKPDILFSFPPTNNKNIWTLFMVDQLTGGLESEFNHSQPLLISKDIEKLQNSYDDFRTFLKPYFSTWFDVPKSNE